MKNEIKRRGFFKSLFGGFAAVSLSPKEVLKGAEEKQEEANKVLSPNVQGYFYSYSTDYWSNRNSS